MSLYIRRVPARWDWPVGTAWAGYINPHAAAHDECPACKGSGYSPQAKRFHDEWYGNAPFDQAAYGVPPLAPDDPALIAGVRRKLAFDAQTAEFYRTHNSRGRRVSHEEAVALEVERMHDHQSRQWCHHLSQADVDALVAAGRLYDFTHEFGHGRGWQPKAPPHPTAAEVNAWSLDGVGHDSINCGVCIRARCEREGVPLYCATCAGDGRVWTSEAHLALAKSWTRTEPPDGPWYQAWRGISEDSPDGPAFATADDLAAWLHDYVQRGGREGLTLPAYGETLAFVRAAGWSPSFAVEDGEMLHGIVAFARQARRKLARKLAAFESAHAHGPGLTGRSLEVLRRLRAETAEFDLIRPTPNGGATTA